MEIALIGFKSVKHQAKDTKATRNEVRGNRRQHHAANLFFTLALCL